MRLTPDTRNMYEDRRCVRDLDTQVRAGFHQLRQDCGNGARPYTDLADEYLVLRMSAA